MQPDHVTHHLTAQERLTYFKYSNLALPRHTSYPSAAVWTDWQESKDHNLLMKAMDATAQARRPISLYVHVPYCRSLCFYCACNKEIIDVNKNDPRDQYLAALEVEIARVAKVLGQSPVAQIHFGGGTPTFLTPEQLMRVGEVLKSNFPRWENLEFSVEIDPRVTTLAHIKALRAMGVNRISIGVQDFEAKVQEAVNRIQPFEQVAQVVNQCRAEGIHLINFDLIYGLPYQTLASEMSTIEKVITLRPNRIAFYRLAVIPEMFKWQKAFKNADLPEGESILEINLQAIETFQKAGYAFIGLDHFALPDDTLYQSLQNDTLRRNFQGMTTGGDLEIIAFGPSGISQFDRYYIQNDKKASHWREASLGHGWSFDKAVTLSDDDMIRREVISQLYCYGTIDKQKISTLFRIDFEEYFANDLQRLQILLNDGLVTNNSKTVQLQGLLGRLLVRTVAAVFDKYLPQDAFMKGLASHQASKIG